MNCLPVATVESGDVRPHILDSDRKENSARFDRGAILEMDRKQLSALVQRALDFAKAVEAINIAAVRATHNAAAGR